MFWLQAFFKKTKLKLLSHCCHCLFNFPQKFLILFYDAHIRGIALAIFISTEWMIGYLSAWLPANLIF